jgi:hypothetical protein
MYTAIYASTWDLVEDGLDHALEQIRASGVNTITLAATRPAGPSPRRREGDARARGTAYFRVRPERYGHIKPHVHPVVSECDGLRELQRVAPDLGGAAWVAGCLDVPSGAGHPQYVACNAFGHPYPHRLCPAHPAVRDYVVNLCSDLARGYDLAAVVLEAPGWLPLDQGYHPDLAAVPLDRFARALLSLCFADTTRHAAKAAGVDADRLQAQTRELLECQRASDDGLATGMAAAWRFADLMADPAWAAFFDWRCGLLADLVTDVKAALPAGTALAVIPAVPCSSPAARLEGSDLAMLARAADALEIPVCQPSAAEARLEADAARQRAGADAALRFVLRPGSQGEREPTVAAVRELEQIGIAGIAFYDYEHLRPGGLAPVRAALEALEQA